MNTYTVSDILKWLDEYRLIYESNISAGAEKVITQITDTSLEVSPDSIFFCKGAGFKKNYLLEALSKGSVVYVTDREDLLGYGESIFVKDIRKTMAVVASKFYGESWKKMTLIGITGTKGKSTTAYMIKAIIDDFLKTTDKKCAIMSSIENYDGKLKEESHLTTQEPLQLHKNFYNMVQNGCSHCVMEVSSQALKYDRVYGIQFDIAAFLNIGEDHISEIEHFSFEDYYQSKLKIFDYAKRVLVSDDLRLSYRNSIYFGRQSETSIENQNRTHFKISVIEINPTKSIFNIEGLGEIEISMAGFFNIDNAAAAAILCKEIGISFNNIQNALKSVNVSGRMEVFRSKTTRNIAIVDYAHNKLSYESLFRSVKQQYPDYKIISIFGCPGKKALQRREELPKIAEQYSDYIYITEEDHGEEPLHEICEEIYSNIKQKKIAEIELDRERAIQKSFCRFEEPALILVLGKGRETRQKRGKEYIDTLSDVDMVQKFIL